MTRLALIVVAFLPAMWMLSAENAAGDELQEANWECSGKRLKAVVQRAFATIHDGWSADEVLLQDELNARFIAACREKCPQATAGDLNWQLINLRKANDLREYAVTKRQSLRHEEYRHAAEIAARLVTDRHELSTDRMLCEPKLRAEFDRVASELALGVPAYRLRKAALGLRKSRQLRPELVLRVANWGRQIHLATVSELRADPSQIPKLPGIYIFRDSQGYLYVGEAADLRQRISEHLASSDRLALADYLTRGQAGVTVTVETHAFPAGSPAAKVRMRRAYESELISSRRPRFNVRR